ncbi:nuclear transport factor 2 family protein [Pseudaestuariivita atlantica]|uniref:SnoaL-like domain-containing protein n=1 Tax=Pseudaestuariivita atlantica TaxID=1317121 RepID=A0A0L1JRH9_9RHOB|nr:nuclear transport factor 2 family protein [Pseudaestuariivita atlantica]KNG94355.1 hypothetical protein ATO11_09185 [Pseudaestuariivita atlantica]
MSDPITTFFNAWSETDAEARQMCIAASFDPHGVYADPRAPEPIRGTKALSDYVGMFSANAPGWTAKVVSTDAVAGLTRATVAFGGKGPDGAHKVQHGQYFVETDGGKITRMTGFAGLGAPE